MLVLMLLNQLVAEYVTDVIVTWSDVIDQCNAYWWPDVKPIHFGPDVIDHLWNRVGHLADVKAMFDGKIIHFNCISGDLTS